MADAALEDHLGDASDDLIVRPDAPWPLACRSSGWAERFGVEAEKECGPRRFVIRLDHQGFT